MHGFSDLCDQDQTLGNANASLEGITRKKADSKLQQIPGTRIRFYYYPQYFCMLEYSYEIIAF